MIWQFCCKGSDFSLYAVRILAKYVRPVCERLFVMSKRPLFGNVSHRECRKCYTPCVTCVTHGMLQMLHRRCYKCCARCASQMLHPKIHERHKALHKCIYVMHRKTLHHVCRFFIIPASKTKTFLYLCVEKVPRLYRIVVPAVTWGFFISQVPTYLLHTP